MKLHVLSGNRKGFAPTDIEKGFYFLIYHFYLLLSIVSLNFNTSDVESAIIPCLFLKVNMYPKRGF